MTGIAFERLRTALESHGSKIKNTGPAKFMAQCPAHEDRTPSLSVTDGDGHALVHCFAGCHVDDVLGALNMAKRDLYDQQRTDYHYEDGRTAHRTPDKEFWQSGNTKGTPTLYRAAEVRKAVTDGRPIYLCEGEKDADNIRKLTGACATSAPMGASNFKMVDPSAATGGHVVAIVDRDPEGDVWAAQVRQKLAAVAVVSFRWAKVGKDASDHLAAGHGLDELLPYEDPHDEAHLDYGERIDPDTGEILDDEQTEEERPRFTFSTGGAFILDTPARPQIVWGDGDDVLAASGEATMLAGVQGTGKSTIGEQFALGRCGFTEYSTLLGYPIVPGAGKVLYLAMDRPRQIARSLRRMVGDAWRDELDDKLVVWTGPPPFDMAKHPGILRDMALEAGADTVVLDSLKDAAIGLNDDEVGAGYNRARQAALVAGVELLELHHGRKAVNGAKRGRLTIDDVYGSTWLTSGAGSVFILSGAPGDPIVDLHHVKQPMNEVGPFKVIHDHDAGRTTLHNPTDLVALAKNWGKVTAKQAAEVLFDTTKPTPADKEKARRRLEALVRTGHLKVLDEGDKATSQPRIWGAT